MKSGKANRWIVLSLLFSVLSDVAVIFANLAEQKSDKINTQAENVYQQKMQQELAVIRQEIEFIKNNLNQ